MTTIQSGIALIDKPEGPSSAQVVGRIKKILQAKKVGHLGTLDPFASGLLLIGVNEGTKIADIFLGGAKSYSAVMTLGIATDSQDRTGQTIEERPVPELSAGELAALEKRFTGALDQVPPMFSALKKDGVRLYELARQGKEIERPARRVHIEGLSLRRVSDTEIAFEVTCSRGTYIRTLAADMGAVLGCGAHLKSLRRTACDHLRIEQALTPEAFEARVQQGELPLLSIHDAVRHLPWVSWPSAAVARLRMGQQDMLSQLGRPKDGCPMLAIGGSRGSLAALVQWQEDQPGGRWRVYRVFHN